MQNSAAGGVQPTDSSAADSPAADSPAGGVVDTVVIARGRQELYDFWRRFSNLPKFMERVGRVTEVDSLSSIWTVRTPDGREAEWEFMVTDDEPGRMLAWASSGHTPVKFSARVEFKDLPTQVGTEVSATVLDESDSRLQTGNDLLRFKQLMEAGP